MARSGRRRCERNGSSTPSTTGWNQLADARTRNATIASVLTADAAGSPEPPEVRTARRALATLPVELDRVLAAIRAGMDANLAAATTKQIQLDLARAESTASPGSSIVRSLSADTSPWRSTTR